MLDVITDVSPGGSSFIPHPFFKDAFQSEGGDSDNDSEIVPMVCIWSEGKQYLGGFVSRLPGGAVCLAHAVQIREGAVQGESGYQVSISLQPVSLALGMMGIMEVTDTAIYYLNSDRIIDSKLVRDYEVVYRSLRAQEAGIALPTPPNLGKLN